MERWLANERNVRACAVLGALAIAFSSILVRLSHASPSTAAIFRCAYALPVLGLLMWLEDRRYGPRSWRERRHVVAAGIFFAADLILWHNSIEDVGAGLATVLANVQVVLVPLVAWAILSERPGAPSARCAATGGARRLVHLRRAAGPRLRRSSLARRAFGVGAGIAYVGFLLLLRAGGADLRRPAGPLFDATATAAVVAIVAGLVIGDARLVPDLARCGLADHARAHLAGARLAADHDLAAAAAGRDHLAAADRAADRVDGPRSADLRRVARAPLQLAGVVLVLSALLVATDERLG